MSRFLLLLGALVCATGAAAAPDPHLTGFPPDGAMHELELEAAFVERVSAEDQDGWMRRLTLRPHHVGSDWGNQNVEYIAGLFEDWGYDVEIRSYRILLPVPKMRLLEMTEPFEFTAALEEMTLDEDPSTAMREDLLPPYHAYSVDGDVTGELVFVNYGLEEDYEWLERNGIDVEGKIVIAKYGRSWRGIKPKIAAEHGAIGTLIYSDPADDGYGVGDVYPDGPFKHRSGVQRGSVMDMPLYPGDPLTPFEPARPRARRLDLDEVPTLTSIPVLPISYGDAEPLLRALRGPVAPQDWFGSLPITYHLGPGPAKVRLALEFDWTMVEARNVIARLEGERWPEQWVMRGNHHDGWNHGAADPISGLVALMSEARALGELAASGQRPARTVIYAAWDAEEQGLIGSTEFVEDMRAELDEHLVAYLNTDGNSRGFLSAGGSHSLQRFVNEVARDTMDPQVQVSVTERARARLKISDDAAARERALRTELPIAPLGSGSDYTPFLQHLGIASTNLAFGGEGPGGSYHTLYDTYEHFTGFRDPGLVYGAALAELNGRATLRLANAPLLPFEFTAVAEHIATWIDEIEDTANGMREDAEALTALIEEGAYDLALDPREPLGRPALPNPVPHVNLAPLRNALDRLQAAAEAYDDLDKDVSGLNDRQLARINAALFRTERLLTREEGLPRRPWFRHHLYAPGFYTGYGVKTLPAVREAVEEEEWGLLDEQVANTAAVIERLADHLTELNETLAGMSGSGSSASGG